MNAFDVIVIGVGGMGSAALDHLAGRGLRVLGLEQFDIAHDRGSSHGETRLIRRAYFEHADYVPLVDRSYELWAELERRSSRRLLHPCGLMVAGRGNKMVMTGVRRAIEEHHLHIEPIPSSEWHSRFPALRPDPDMEVLFESDAGVLEVENCVLAHVEQAIAQGAVVRTGQEVCAWSSDATSVTVTTTDGQYTAANLVICGGAWTAPLVASLQLPLVIRRKIVLWFAAPDSSYTYQSGCPVFLFETPAACFYGFPALGERGVKVADHFGDERVADARHLDRTVHGPEEEPLQRCVTRYLPGLGSTITRRSVCTYTMTPDEHFIVDRHRDHPRVVYACGFSGHGFKFAPLIGKALADLVAEGRTSETIGALRADRPGI